MKTRLVRIGNCQAIRIPKLLLEQAGLHGDVEISAVDGALLIRHVRKPREGWEAQLRDMARRRADKLLDDVPYPLSTWDETEWEW